MSGKFTFTLPITLQKDAPADISPVVDPVVPVITPEPVVKPIVPDILDPVEPMVPVEKDNGINLFDTDKPAGDEPVVDEFEFAAQELELELPEGVTKWNGKLIAEQAKAKIEDSRQYLNLDD